METTKELLVKMRIFPSEMLLNIFTVDRAKYTDEEVKIAELLWQERNVEEGNFIEKEENTEFSFAHFQAAGEEEFEVEGGDSYYKKVESQKKFHIIILAILAPLTIILIIYRLSYYSVGLGLIYLVYKLISLTTAAREKSITFNEIKKVKEELDANPVVISNEVEQKTIKLFQRLNSYKSYGGELETLLKFYEDEILSKEQLLELEVAYKHLYYADLYQELLNLSNSYNTIKLLVGPYIKYQLAEKEYPHSRIE